MHQGAHIAVHNSDDSSVEPKEVSASASEVFSAGAQHVCCSDKELKKSRAHSNAQEAGSEIC